MLNQPRLGLVAFLFMAAAAVNTPLVAQSNGQTLAKASSPAAASSSVTNADSDRVRDGLAGPVRRMRTEMAKLSNKGGKMTEGQRVLLESVAYDVKGNKTENAYFPVVGATLTGKEVYKYDDKGNIREMTLLNADGSLLSKEIYSYEYDFAGNWTKMTTSVAVVEGGKVNFEPTEVTYRTISYYLTEENIAKLSQPAVPAATNNVKAEAHASAANNAAAPNNVRASNNNAPALPSAHTLDKSDVNTAALSAMPTVSGTTASNNAPVVKLDGEPELNNRPKPILKPVTGGVLNGKATNLPKPIYPELAKRAGATGTVSVEVVIDETGKVVSARATNGNAMLQQAAVQAARQAKFSPTLLSGQPVKVQGTITYNFELGKR